MQANPSDLTAEQELRNLQALALSLQGVTPQYGVVSTDASADEQMAHQLQQLDALDSELAAFERRFASADPEVKRMLAQMLSQDMSNPNMFLHGNGTPAEQCFPIATPTSSDSAQTFPSAGGPHVQHHAAVSCTSGGGDYGGSSRAAMPVTSAQGGHQASSACPPSGARQAAVHGQGHLAPDEPMAIDGPSKPAAKKSGGDGALAAMFPAVTPANSLAQQAVQRDTLSDCAASLPMPASNPPGVKDTILANQLRHRLHDMEHDMPHMSGSIRDTLTHISLKDSSFPSSADQV